MNRVTFFSNKSSIFRYITVFILFVFFSGSVLPPQNLLAQTASFSALNLSASGVMVRPTSVYTPAMVRGMSIHPDNPLRFSFIIDQGDSGLDLHSEAFRKESQKLVKYFLASLTVPEKEQWVNLSPYEKDRMTGDGLGRTQMGRDMLAQDYVLKQLTASLMYPEDELGKTFWSEVYVRARARYGISDIPADTFNKVWIMPDRGVVYEKGNRVFVIEQHLKVMLEEDYLALSGHKKLQSSSDAVSGNAGQPDGIVNEAVRQVILPAIEKEVNTGKNFAILRQIYNSMILAVWYKKTLRETLLGQVYVDKNRSAGISSDPKVREEIYEQYLASVRQGVYQYIKEEVDPASRELVPRKYVSGGEVGFSQKDLAMASDEAVRNWAADMAQKSAAAVTVDFAALKAEDSSEAFAGLFPRSVALAGGRNNAGTFLPSQQMRSKTDWGIGDMGAEKLAVDLHKELGMHNLQILPFGPSSAYNSPYSVLSSILIDPSRISIPDLLHTFPSEELRDFIKQNAGEIERLNNLDQIDYPAVTRLKMEALRVLWADLRKQEGFSGLNDKMRVFLADNPKIGNHILFELVKNREIRKEQDAGVFFEKTRGWDWRLWEQGLRDRNPARMQEVKNDMKEDMEFYSFVQYAAFQQFEALVDYGKSRGVNIIVDMPFALDGADIWENPEIFGLKRSQGYRALTKQGVPAERAYPAGQYWQFFPIDWSNERAVEFVLDRYRFLQKWTGGIRLDHVLGYYRIYHFTQDPQQLMTLQKMGLYDKISARQAQALDGTEEDKEKAVREIYEWIREALMTYRREGLSPQLQAVLPAGALELTFAESGELRQNNMIQIARAVREDSGPAPESEGWSLVKYDVESSVFDGKFSWNYLRITPDVEIGDKGFLYNYLFGEKSGAVLPDDGIRLGYFEPGPGDAIMSRFLALAQKQGSLQIWETLGVVPPAIQSAVEALGGANFLPGIWGEVPFWGAERNPFFPDHHLPTAMATLSLHDSPTYKYRWEEDLKDNRKAKVDLLNRWFPDNDWTEEDVTSFTDKVREAALNYFVFSSPALTAIPNWLDILGLGDGFRLNIPGKLNQWTARLPKEASIEHLLMAARGQESASSMAAQGVQMLKRLMEKGKRLDSSFAEHMNAEQGTVIHITPEPGTKVFQLRETGGSFQVDADVLGHNNNVELLVRGAQGKQVVVMRVVNPASGDLENGYPRELSHWTADIKVEQPGMYFFDVIVRNLSGEKRFPGGTLVAVDPGTDLNPLSSGYALKEADMSAMRQAVIASENDSRRVLLDNVKESVSATLLGIPQGGLTRLRSFLSAATGNEEGYYIATDWGGTNLRVVLVRLQAGQEPVILDQYTVKDSFPQNIIDGKVSSDGMFDFVAEKVGLLIKKIETDPQADPRILARPLGLGAGFSFATELSANGVAQLKFAGVKGWAFPGLSMQERGSQAPNLIQLHQEAIDRNTYLRGKVVVKTLPNDTIALALAVAGTVAIIDGTGANMAVRDPQTGELINLEFGAFDRISDELWTTLDRRVFEEVDPGVHKWEKMVSGKYLVELLKRILEKADNKSSALSDLFANPGLDSWVLSLAITDSPVSERNRQLESKYGKNYNLSDNDWKFLGKESRLLLERAGRILGISIAGVLDAVDPQRLLAAPVIAFDGSVIKSDFVRDIAAKQIRQLRGKEVVFRTIEEATAIGTAVSAAVAPVTPGGVTFDSSGMNFEIRRDANGMPLPAGRQSWDRIRVEGFEPVIHSVTPVFIPALLAGE